MSDLARVADVLDATADYLDALEREKTSSARATRQAQIDTLANKYAESTGEEMPESIRKKLAESDQDVVGLVQGMIEKQAGVVEQLGGPSSRSDAPEARTVKEAAEEADKRFLEWVTS